MTMTDTPTETISSARLRELRSEDPGLRILDVRTGGEFESGHIPGSFNVPLDMLGDHVGELAGLDHSIVLVCQSGGRATKACNRLTGAGKGEVYVLDGGMNSWLEGGGDVAAGERKRWAMDRQVRLVAGSLVLAGVLTSVVVPKAKWLSAGVGAGLLFSAVTDTCAMAGMLSKLPYNRTETCDFGTVLEQLEEAA
jgi:rhodanese-related sulfurtransferase